MSSDSTTVLFGLPGVRVKKVARAADGARVVHVVTDDEAAAACPQCGVVSTSVRQRRTSRPRDVPYGEQPLRVRWHKVQYACQQDACPRKAFTEQIDELPAGARVTGRLRRHVATRIGEGLPVSVAGAGLLGWPAAHDAFVAAVVEQLPEPEPVRVLGIDETRRGKPRWARDAGSGTWTKLETFETNFVDLAGTQGLLGQASGRTKANVVAWLTDRGQAWTDAVEVVAMDPCATYRAAVAQALPRARIVADHFHLVRLANQALTDVRRRVTWITHGRRGRASDPEWAQRRRLLRGYERLTGEQFRRMWNDLVDADPSGRILTRLDRQGGAAPAAGLRPNRRAPAGDLRPAAPVQRLVRRLEAARTRASGRHDRGLVARGARLPADRHHQRRHRGHQPDREDRRTHRLRLPQPGQPAPSGTVRMHPAHPPGHRLLRVISPSKSKSRHFGW